MSTAAEKIALVTGANRGIGREVARQLAERGFRVIVGARKAEAGRKAAAELGAGGGHVEFLEIDVADAAGISRAAQELAGRIDHLDVLVNNAGILEDGTSTALNVGAGVVRRSFETNTLGALLVAQAMVPLLHQASEGARIINVSSGAGALGEMTSWAPAYSISKAGLNAVTRQLAAVLRTRHIAVNSACPGWVRTDMGGAGASRSVAQGADTIVWLATEAPLTLTGKFFRDRKVIGW